MCGVSVTNRPCARVQRLPSARLTRASLCCTADRSTHPVRVGARGADHRIGLAGEQTQRVNLDSGFGNFASIPVFFGAARAHGARARARRATPGVRRTRRRAPAREQVIRGPTARRFRDRAVRLARDRACSAAAPGARRLRAPPEQDAMRQRKGAPLRQSRPSPRAARRGRGRRGHDCRRREWLHCKPAVPAQHPRGGCGIWARST